MKKKDTPPTAAVEIHAIKTNKNEKKLPV